jgi:transglutaminase-like putative cysteine protease
MIEKNSRLLVLLQVILYGYGALLLWEWLQPVNELTDTDNIIVFVLFALLSLLLHSLQVHWLIRLLVLVGYMVYSIQYLYSQISFFELFWITEMLVDAKVNFSKMFTGDWLLLSNQFRTFLFFVLLWLVTYLIHYWVTVKKNLFLFFLLTILYVSVIDTFSPYDAAPAIIRIMIIGFTVLGLLTFFRLATQEKLAVSGVGFRKWLIPLAIMVSLSATIGFAAPKLDPQWPDPVPFIKSYSNSANGNLETDAVKKVGYSENDERLGGSIEDDDSVVFYADVNVRHYWKVENKMTYTGKGWISPQKSGTIEFNNGEDISKLTVNQDAVGIKLEEMTAHVTVQESHSHIPYPNHSSLKRVALDDGDRLQYNEETQRLTVHAEPWGRVNPAEYQLDYYLNRFDTNTLRKVTGPADTSADFIQSYTELPETVPDRVYQLANELTADKENWYDKAKTIENYFDRPDFTYNKENIPYPAEEQDFVDHFLFETMRGYCDHFSTAMVVMLRAIDIPARWVKGYTDGSLSVYQGEQMNAVTNNDAHSWVEVYFPETGWVPFEPTKGFSNSSGFYDSVSDANSNSMDDQPEITPEVQETPEREQTEAPARKPEEANSASSSDNAAIGSWKFGAAMMVLFSAVVYGIFKSRRKWLPYVLITRFKARKDEHTFTHAYQALLQQLNRAGVKRPKGQTLREYAAYVDSWYGLDEKNMQTMTSEYEKILYRGDQEKNTWDKNRELWENLIKRTAY